MRAKAASRSAQSRPAQPGYGFCQFSFAATGNDHLSAFAGQGFSGRRPDTAPATGNQRHLIVQSGCKVQHISVLFEWWKKTKSPRR